MVADGVATGALAPVATYYGRSLEESYLIVDPVLPLLVASSPPRAPSGAFTVPSVT